MKISGKISGFANSEIAAELKAAVLYRDYDNPVQKIADMLGLSNRTIYDYFDGHIKISLPFLHACLIVTGGDPEVKKFLCPEGWEIVPKVMKAPTDNIDKEGLDVHLAASELIMAVRAARADGKTTQSEIAGIEILNNRVYQEIGEYIAAVKAEHRKEKLKIA